MRHYILKLMSLFLIPGLVILMNCSPTAPDDSAGNSSETGNVGLVSGYLYNADGTPAKNAKVYFITSDHLPSVSKSLAKTLATMAVGDSTTTDSTGWFGLDSMPADTYNVFGEDPDGNLSYQDSVVITGDTANPDTVPPDTVKLPGSLAGFLKMEPGDDPRTVTMYVIGATKYALPETDASFSLADMAGGAYRVRILSTLDKYLPLDTTLTVNPGEDLNLPDSIVLPLKIPKITGFTVDYDTLKQIVTLSWDKADTGRVKGYNVYRQHIDSTEVKLNLQTLSDTFYVDSTGIQDETYIFSIVGVDLNSDEGIKVSGDSVDIAGAFTLVDSVGAGILQGYQRLNLANNGDIYILDVIESENRWTINIFDSGYNLKDSVSVHDSILFRPSAFDLDSSLNLYVFNKDGIFKLDSAATILDTITNWSNNENKDLVIYDSLIFAASGELRKYSLDGTLIDSSSIFNADGAILIYNNKLYATGQNNIVKIFDLNLQFLEDWSLDFNLNEETRQIAQDETNQFLIFGYHYNPNSFALLLYDSNQNYAGKFNFNSMIYDLQVSNGKLLFTSNGQVKVYQLR